MRVAKTTGQQRRSLDSKWTATLALFAGSSGFIPPFSKKKSLFFNI
jgi:hypothetical protein